MDSKNVTRREFLNVAAMGVTLVAVGQVVKAAEKEGAVPASAAKSQPPKASGPGIFVCGICGHVAFGGPDTCPVCHAPKEKFTQDDTLFINAEANNKTGGEKHVPVITLKKQSELIAEPCKEVVVRIGKTLHPMVEDHFIRFIDCYVDDKYVERVILTPGAMPATTAYIKVVGSKIRVVEYCTVHGYWQAEA
jgi:desulfoferrodoxin-like iron-binding protein